MKKFYIFIFIFLATSKGVQNDRFVLRENETFVLDCDHKFDKIFRVAWKFISSDGGSEIMYDSQQPNNTFKSGFEVSCEPHETLISKCSLQLVQSRKEDSGKYICYVGKGNEAQLDFNLLKPVTEVELIIRRPEYKTLVVNKGDPIILPCEHNIKNLTRARWSHVSTNDVLTNAVYHMPAKETSNKNYEVQCEPHELSCNLKILKANKESAGKYICKVGDSQEFEKKYGLDHMTHFVEIELVVGELNEKSNSTTFIIVGAILVLIIIVAVCMLTIFKRRKTGCFSEKKKREENVNIALTSGDKRNFGNEVAITICSPGDSKSVMDELTEIDFVKDIISGIDKYQISILKSSDENNLKRCLKVGVCGKQYTWGVYDYDGKVMLVDHQFIFSGNPKKILIIGYHIALVNELLKRFNDVPIELILSDFDKKIIEFCENKVPLMVKHLENDNLIKTKKDAREFMEENQGSFDQIYILSWILAVPLKYQDYFKFVKSALINGGVAYIFYTITDKGPTDNPTDIESFNNIRDEEPNLNEAEVRELCSGLEVNFLDIKLFNDFCLKYIQCFNKSEGGPEMMN